MSAVDCGRKTNEVRCVSNSCVSNLSCIGILDRVVAPVVTSDGYPLSQSGFSVVFTPNEKYDVDRIVAPASS